MHGRKTIVQILSEFKKIHEGDNAISRCTHAIMLLPRAEIIKAFLALPCFLDIAQVESNSAQLIRLVNGIDTIECHMKTGKTTLVKECDKEIISNIQKELIQHALLDLLDRPLQIKPTIKQLLNVTDHNLSATSLVLASVMNMIMYIANYVAVRCTADNLNDEHWVAISGALLNLAQVEKLVQEAIDQVFLTTLNQPRQTLVDIIRANKDSYAKQIELAKIRIETKDAGGGGISRFFDNYPDLLDGRDLSLFSKKYCEYLTCINQKSLVYQDQQAINLKSDCEDSYCLEEFERYIILVGIVDLLDESHNIRQDVRHAITVSTKTDLDPARLLGAYVSAVNTSIINKAHPSNINSSLAIEPAIWGALNKLRGGWVRDMLRDSRGRVLVANDNHEVNQWPSYLPGVGLVAAVTAAAAATVAVMGFFAHYRRGQSDSTQETLSPRLNKHQ